MHRTALLVLVLVLVLVLGCSTPAPNGNDGGDSGGPDANLSPRTFVLRKMFAGDGDRAFKTNPTAWRSYGEDLDGVTTTASSQGACALAQGASPDVQADGDSGIDNSFGANVLPLLVTNGLAIPSLQWSESIQQGATRPILVRLDGAIATIRAGALLPSPPDFNSGAGEWLVSSLPSTDVDLVQMGDLVHANGSGAAVIFVPFGKGTLQLRVHRPSLRASSSLTGGTLAGILDTTELVEAVRQAIGATKPSACTSFDAIASAIRQAQDIPIGGAPNPSAACDGISIGVGFEGVTMGFGAVVNDPGPAVPCP